MRETFHKQLDKLQVDVLEMARIARVMLGDGVESLLKLDKKAAQLVLDQTKELARLDDKIEEEALLLVARQQPMARDMRFVAAALKLITYINRVGRYGRDMAEITLEWKEKSHEEFVAPLRSMTQLTLRMFDAVIESYRKGATFKLDELQTWENTLDKARWDTFRRSVAFMTKNPTAVERGAHYMMAARYLERVGDNVCKMGEKVHYAITGERIEIH